MNIKFYVRMTLMTALILSIMMLCACGSGASNTATDQKASSEVSDSTEKTVAESVKEDNVTVTAVPGKKITVQADGEKKDVTTEAATVQELLDELKLTAGKDDIVEPAADKEIKSGDTVTVKRVTFKEEKVKEEIPFETKTKDSDTLEAGTSEVTQQGEAGEKTTVVRIRYIDGAEADKEIVSEEVTKKPVDEIVTNGTKQQEAEPETEPESEPESQPEPESEPEEYYEEEYVEPEEYYEPEPEPEPEPQPEPQSERTIVSKEAFPNCDDGSHGYYVITYSDGSVEYEEY